MTIWAIFLCVFVTPGQPVDCRLVQLAPTATFATRALCESPLHLLGKPPVADTGFFQEPSSGGHAYYVCLQREVDTWH